MTKAKRLLFLLLLVIAIYPTSLTVQVTLDWYIGDGEFLNWLTNDSKSRLLEQVINDWFSATGWIILMISIIRVLEYLTHRLCLNISVIVAISCAILLILTILSLPTLLITAYCVSLAFFSFWTCLFNRNT